MAIDAVPDTHLAIANGEMNASIELTPNISWPALDALEKYLADGTMPPKWIGTESKLYNSEDDDWVICEMKKSLGYRSDRARDGPVPWHSTTWTSNST